MILRVGERGVVSGNELRTALRPLRPGEVVEVLYRRGEKDHKVAVTLAELEI